MTMRTRNHVLRTLPVILAVLASSSTLQGQMADTADDEHEIRRVVMEGYVVGIHGNGDREAVRTGFHPEFVMKVLGRDGAVANVTIQDWMARLPAEGTPPAQPVTAEIPRVLLSGNAAVAEIHIAREGEQIYTDFISLYRFPEGWRMVAKVYYRHPTS